MVRLIEWSRVRTDAADSEGQVVQVEAVDPLPVRQEPENDPADGVSDPNHRQQEAGVVLVDAKQQCPVVLRNAILCHFLPCFSIACCTTLHRNLGAAFLS